MVRSSIRYLVVRLLTIKSPGIGASKEIRALEAARLKSYEEDPSSFRTAPSSTKILALTGMSSLEDKRRAFEAGVDG